MDQYSLGDANLDYTVSYLWAPEPFVTPNFATNVYSSWPLIHGLGIRYDVDAIQDFYFTNCQLLLSHATFQECALNLSVEKTEECLQLDFVGCNEIENGICPESFNFKMVGNGFTCEVSPVAFKYFGSENCTFYIGTLCIQTTQVGIDGYQISANQASDLMADIWNVAQDLVALEFVSSNHTMNNQDYKQSFIENLIIGLNNRFQNNGNSLSVTNGPCFGNIPPSKPKYSILCF